MRIIADIETDGLLDSMTKIHCLCYQGEGKDVVDAITEYPELIKFLQQPNLEVIGHNFVRFDKPALEKILGQKFHFKVIDTLPLSWTLYPNMEKHGLEAWGNELKISKPEIKDWSNLSTAEYIYRCTEDVKINTLLWQKQLRYLNHLYDKDQVEIDRYCQYLSFKMDCVREQEEIGIKLDVGKAKNMLEKLTVDKELKTSHLLVSMPKNPIKKKITYENAIEDKNGNLFQKGDLFYEFVDVPKIPKKITKEVIKRYEPPNPNSHTQIKNWLYSLGWVPGHIKHVRDKETNETKKIPQIASQYVKGEVCDSIKALFPKKPELELLNGLSILSHRISIFDGFLKEQKDDRLYPTCTGLTNTLRLQHKVVVNLPGFDKAYGNEVRGCLIADDGKMLCGSDLSGIEDNTKRHYIYKYDPKYVEEMNVPGFDPHLDIAILAGFLTKEEADDHKLYEETKGKEGKSYKSVRHKAKTTNFSATYGVKAPSLARNANISEKEAKKLLDIYWKRNHAITKIANNVKVKEIYGQKWLQNPVSGFWYTLRAEKDKFSTLNQGTAVYVFDTWLKYIRQQGIKISYQCHDEWLGNTYNEEECQFAIDKAIKKVNQELQLNIKIACSAAFGKNYAECH